MEKNTRKNKFTYIYIFLDLPRRILGSSELRMTANTVKVVINKLCHAVFDLCGGGGGDFGVCHFEMQVNPI